MAQEIDLNYVHDLLEKQAAALAEQIILDLKEKYEANLDILEKRAERAEMRDSEIRKLLGGLGINHAFGAHANEDDRTAAKDKLNRTLQMGMHLEIILQANEENETVRAAWEKFMLTLRMCGYDGK